MDLHKPDKIQEFLLVLSSFSCLFKKKQGSACLVALTGKTELLFYIYISHFEKFKVQKNELFTMSHYTVATNKLLEKKYYVFSKAA